MGWGEKRAVEDLKMCVRMTLCCKHSVGGKGPDGAAQIRPGLWHVDSPYFMKDLSQRWPKHRAC
jgi:hypothetical protein